MPSVETSVSGNVVRVRLDTQGDLRVAVWKIFDPSTDTLLFEGESLFEGEGDGDVAIPLPAEEGAYRVHVASPGGTRKFFSIEAKVLPGRIEIAPPRLTSVGALRRRRFFSAIPKAFYYPVRSITQNHTLMMSMVRRDILARYRGSFGGSLWTLLNPLLLMATYFFLFGVVLQQRFPGDLSRSGYVLYFLAGMLPWLAFSEAVGRSPSIMLEYRTFVKKIVFPLETLPVNLVIAGAVTELFGIAIFLAGLFIARGSVPLSIVWLPLLIVPQLLLTAGVCWFLSALGVFVRDLGQVIGFVLTLWFFLTPICYEESQLRVRAPLLLTINPIFMLVRGYRAVLLEHRAPDAHSLMMLWLVALAAAILGHAWFHRLRRSFADVI